MDRYAGKPLLRLLECYVLWAIGELSAEQALPLQQMTPKLAEVYGQQGTWQDIIASVMGFSPDLPAELGALWLQNKQCAEASKVDFSADEFARGIVDQNFSE